MLVLSPDGYEPESSIGQGITAVMERGVPLLGVVRERWTPAAAPAPDPRSVAPPPGRISASVRRPSYRLSRPVVVVAATLAAGAAGSWALLARGAEQRGVPVPAPHPAAPVRARPVAAAPAPRVDSLAWTVQLAAYARLDKALGLADRLAADGVTPFVTPVALDDPRGRAVWYRVLAGAFPTRDAALGGRAGMWKHGLAARGQGDRKSTRLNSSHLVISYAVFCLKKKKKPTSARGSSTSTTPLCSARRAPPRSVCQASRSSRRCRR